MGLSLGVELVPQIRRLTITVAGGSFVLLLKPVSEEARVEDQGLASRFYQADDPEEVKQWFRAREESRLNLSVAGWEGVTAPDGSGVEVPVPYSVAALRRVMALPGVRAAVGNQISDHFSGIGQAVEESVGESQRPPDVSSAAGATMRTLQPSSAGS